MSQRSNVNNDVLRETVRSFLNWRNAEKWRSQYKSRLQKHAYAGFYRATDENGRLYATEWPFRDCGNCDEISGARINHKGWFCTIDSRATIRGRVLQLPSSRGVHRYIAGTYSNDYDGVTLYVDRIFDDSIDAARYADECARREAEISRDEDVKTCAQQQIEGGKERITEIRRSMKSLIIELKSLRRYQLLSVQPCLPFMGEEAPAALCEKFPLLISSAISKLKQLSKEKSDAAKRIILLASDPFLVLE